MAISSYDSLQESVLRWLARPGDPLTAPSVPDMIMLFEVEANRRIRSTYNEWADDAVTVAGYSVAALPLDFLQMRAARMDGVTRHLEYVTLAQFADLPQNETGEPRYYTTSMGGSAHPDTGIVGLPQLQLWPTPTDDTLVRVRYWRVIPFLSPSVQINWLLSYYPDAYLFGTLAEAAPFIGHDERVQLWMQRRDASFAGINKEGQKLPLGGGGGLQIRVDGVTP